MSVRAIKLFFADWASLEAFKTADDAQSFRLRWRYYGLDSRDNFGLPPHKLFLFNKFCGGTFDGFSELGGGKCCDGT